MNGVYTKLEKDNVLRLLLKFDIVALYEVKTNLRVSLPGFIPYRSTTMASHRGGTILFVHKSLRRCITHIDTSVQDQVWLHLTVLGAIMLGFCYVPPSDSPYYDPSSFSSIQEKVKSYEEQGMSVALLGDINARFGGSVRDIPRSANIPDAHRYTYR